MKSLSNHFIISMPHMNDPIFSKSLIFICEHNKDGAMGIIINKPMISENTEDIINQTGLSQINPSPEIYFGGPVKLDMGIILHDSSYTTDGTLPISKTIALTSNNKIIDDLKNGSGPSVFRFSFGYSGWEEEQLEREIENGDWLLMPADDNFIFSVPNADKWEKAALKFGIDILDLGGSAGIA
jgi:putative transcriptional regulator